MEKDNKIQLLEQNIKNYLEEINKYKIQLINKNSNIQSLESQIKKSTEENKDLKSINEELNRENKCLKEFLDPKKLTTISISADIGEKGSNFNNEINNTNYNNIIKEKEEKINNLNKTIDSLTKENNDLKLKLLKANTLKNEIDELNQKIKEEEKKNSDLNHLYKDLQQKYDVVNNEMKLNQIISQRQEKGKLRESGLDISVEDNQDLFKNLENSNNDAEADDLKKKNEELENEIMNLRKQLDLKEISDKSMVSRSELEKVEKEKNFLQSELSIEKQKNIKASEKINQLEESLRVSTFQDNDKINEKAKKYKIVSSYVKQVLNIWKPDEKNGKYLFDKLKSIIDNEEKMK